MKIYNVDRGGRPGTLAALIGVPALVAAAVVARYAGGVHWVLWPALTVPAVPYLLGVRALWASLHSWVEVTADGITWSTPAPNAKDNAAKTRDRSTRHLSPSGTIPADRIAAIAITPFTRSSAPAQDRTGAASFAVVVHLMDGGRVVLPVTSPPAPVSQAMDRLLQALAHLPGVPPIDISPLAGIPRARTFRSPRATADR